MGWTLCLTKPSHKSKSKLTVFFPSSKVCSTSCRRYRRQRRKHSKWVTLRKGRLVQSKVSGESCVRSVDSSRTCKLILRGVRQVHECALEFVQIAGVIQYRCICAADRLAPP